MSRHVHRAYFKEPQGRRPAMSESVHQDLPVPHHDTHIALRMSAEQILVIRKAAELAGWTVTDYVLATVLDRAERDLHV
ncbi:DUF1778 domain-containing protein, partial [Actinomadura sp. GC306]